MLQKHIRWVRKKKWCLTRLSRVIQEDAIDACPSVVPSFRSEAKMILDSDRQQRKNSSAARSKRGSHVLLPMDSKMATQESPFREMVLLRTMVWSLERWSMMPALSLSYTMLFWMETSLHLLEAMIPWLPEIPDKNKRM